MGKRKGVGYQHKVTVNAKARESEMRRAQQLRNIEVKRLQNNVEKIRQTLLRYPKSGVLSNKKQKLDPLYDLKGAARPALGTYKDPNYDYHVETDDDYYNVFEKCKGNLWEHTEGQMYLQTQLELAVALHNIGNRTKEAIKIINSVLEEDPNDHLLARHRLLRCYLDLAEADKARDLLERYPDDQHCCFCYSRALIEHISCLLGEEGSSEALKNNALMKAYEANPYALWMIVYNEEFEELSRLLASDTTSVDAREGSIDDAISFIDIDNILWVDTDGALEWIRHFVDKNGLIPVQHSDDDVQQVDGDDGNTANGMDNYSNIRQEFIDLYNNMVESCSSLEENTGN